MVRVGDGKRPADGRARALFRTLRAAIGLSSGAGTWLALGIAFAAVTTLGTIGFTRYETSFGEATPLASRIYAALQLFVLEGGAVEGAVPWELELARYAAPLVAAYAIVRALAVLFREQLDALRLRHVRDHVVVAGTGRKGALLVRRLLLDGERVVAIDRDPANPELDRVRARGGLVLTGDARSPDTLRRARVSRARHLVVLCGDDVTNAEIYAQAREQASARRSGTLQCVVHLVDPELCLLLRGEELERYGSAPIRVDFVNVYAAGAQALVRAHPPMASGADVAPVVVVGSGPTASHLQLALARAWALAPLGARRRLPVTVVADGDGAGADLVSRHGELARFVDLSVVPDLRSLEVATAPQLVFVAPDDDPAAATRALELRSMLLGKPTRIVVVLEQQTGIGHLLDGAPEPSGGPTLATFGLLDEACEPEVLLTGTHELIAQALHRAYLDAHPQPMAEEDPTLRPWAELPEALRDSNRDHAAHVAVKLAAIGDSIGPLVDWDGAQRPFTPEELETMARLEHDRWSAERRRAGWRPGPRDPIRHTTPYLVPWEALSDEMREQDRMFVRQLPELLASVGLQVRRADAHDRSGRAEIGEEAEDASLARRGR